MKTVTLAVGLSTLAVLAFMNNVIEVRNAVRDQAAAKPTSEKETHTSTNVVS